MVILVMGEYGWGEGDEEEIGGERERVEGKGDWDEEGWRSAWIMSAPSTNLSIGFTNTNSVPSLQCFSSPFNVTYQYQHNSVQIHSVLLGNTNTTRSLVHSVSLTITNITPSTVLYISHYTSTQKFHLQSLQYDLPTPTKLHLQRSLLLQSLLFSPLRCFLYCKKIP